jgi:hypothetical protein
VGHTAPDFTAETSTGDIINKDMPRRLNGALCLNPNPNRRIQPMDRRHYFASSLAVAALANAQQRRFLDVCNGSEVSGY